VRFVRVLTFFFLKFIGLLIKNNLVAWRYLCDGDAHGRSLHERESSGRVITNDRTSSTAEKEQYMILAAL
jgi:hypothetical protein